MMMCWWLCWWTNDNVLMAVLMNQWWCVDEPMMTVLMMTVLRWWQNCVLRAWDLFRSVAIAIGAVKMMISICVLASTFDSNGKGGTVIWESLGDAWHMSVGLFMVLVVVVWLFTLPSWIPGRRSGWRCCCCCCSSSVDESASKKEMYEPLFDEFP